MEAVIGLVSFQALDFPTDSAKAGYGCLSTNQDAKDIVEINHFGISLVSRVQALVQNVILHSANFREG